MKHPKRARSNLACRLLVFGSSLALAVQTSAYPVLLIEDTFTTNSPSRDAGDPLTGTSTEVGAKTWTANAMAFGSDSAIHQTSTSAYYSAFVPFTPSSPLPGTWLQLQADVHAVGSFNSNDWIGLGFFDAAQTTDNNVANHDLWVLLSEAGFYTVFADGANKVLGTGSAPNYNPGGFNNLWLEYHGDSNSVEVRINNVPITLGTNNLGTVGFTPSIAHVGFTMLRQASAGAVDNFQLFLVPEPSVALLAALAWLPLSRRWRRNEMRRRSHRSGVLPRTAV